MSAQADSPNVAELEDKLDAIRHFVRVKYAEIEDADAEAREVAEKIKALKRAEAEAAAHARPQPPVSSYKVVSDDGHARVALRNPTLGNERVDFDVYFANDSTCLIVFCDEYGAEARPRGTSVFDDYTNERVHAVPTPRKNVYRITDRKTVTIFSYATPVARVSACGFIHVVDPVQAFEHARYERDLGTLSGVKRVGAKIFHFCPLGVPVDPERLSKIVDTTE